MMFLRNYVHENGGTEKPINEISSATAAASTEAWSIEHENIKKKMLQRELLLNTFGAAHGSANENNPFEFKNNPDWWHQSDIISLETSFKTESYQLNDLGIFQTEQV